MRSLGPWLVVLLQPLIWLWPLPVVARGGLVGVSHSEVATHLWGWWAVGREGGLVGAHTDLLAFPEGLEVQLIDPLHRLPWMLGSALGGPTWGWALVLLWGLWVAGIAGLLLAREAGAGAAGQVLGAVAAGSAATMVGVGADGITEGLGAGWVGIQLVALLWLARASGLERRCRGPSCWAWPWLPQPGRAPTTPCGAPSSTCPSASGCCDARPGPS